MGPFKKTGGHLRIVLCRFCPKIGAVPSKMVDQRFRPSPLSAFCNLPNVLPPANHHPGFKRFFIKGLNCRVPRAWETKPRCMGRDNRQPEEEDTAEDPSRLLHPPTQDTTALAVEECVTLSGIVSTMRPHASADFAHWRMTHRSLSACAPKRFSAQGRRWVWLLGTTGLPVGLHGHPPNESQTIQKSPGFMIRKPGFFERGAHLFK